MSSTVDMPQQSDKNSRILKTGFSNAMSADYIEVGEDHSSSCVWYLFDKNDPRLSSVFAIKSNEDFGGKFPVEADKVPVSLKYLFEHYDARLKGAVIQWGYVIPKDFCP
jgi:hypothetical protein